MANVLSELFQNTADAIREKTGDTGTMKPAEFPDKIRAIETGGGVGNLIPLVVTENGTYLPTAEPEYDKTYLLKSSYTQEELQSLYHLSSTKSDDGMYAYLYLSDVMLGIAYSNGLYGVYLSNGSIWLPEAFTSQMGSSEGWYQGADLSSLSKMETSPTFLFAKNGEAFVDNITVLNPLLQLPIVNGFSEVVVNVENSSDIPDGYLKPEGTLQIAENGTFDVSAYANAKVSVPTGGGSSMVLPPQYEEIGAAFPGYEKSSFNNLRYSDDGTKIYGYNSNKLHIFDASSYPFTLISAEQISSQTAYGGVFSPDFTKLALRHGGDAPYFSVYDCTTTPFTLLFEPSSNPMTYTSKNVNIFEWSKNGELLCVGFDSGYAVYRWENNTFNLIYKRTFSEYNYRRINLLCDERLIISVGSKAPNVEFLRFDETGALQPVTISGIKTTNPVTNLVINGNRLAMIYNISEVAFIGEFVIDFENLTATELFNTRLNSSTSGVVKYFSNGDLLTTVYVDKNLQRFQSIDDCGCRKVSVFSGTFPSTVNDFVIRDDDEYILCNSAYDENIKTHCLRKIQI